MNKQEAEMLIKIEKAEWILARMKFGITDLAPKLREISFKDFPELKSTVKEIEVLLNEVIV